MNRLKELLHEKEVEVEKVVKVENERIQELRDRLEILENEKKFLQVFYLIMRKNKKFLKLILFLLHRAKWKRKNAAEWNSPSSWIQC